MERICCIMDFDGFSLKNYTNKSTYKNEFLIREIGFVRIDPEFGTFLAKSYRFDLSFFEFSHCKDAWSTINHQTRYITGLSFKPEPNEKVYNYDDRLAIVKSIYHTCRQPELDIVAFKSGVYEKELLCELGIPWLDLGIYGCLKYEELVKKKMVFSQLTDCGYHKRIGDSAQIVHCPRAEVTAFRDWMLLYHSVGIGYSISVCGSIAESSQFASGAGSCSDVSSSSE